VLQAQLDIAELTRLWGGFEFAAGRLGKRDQLLFSKGRGTKADGFAVDEPILRIGIVG